MVLPFFQVILVPHAIQPLLFPQVPNEHTSLISGDLAILCMEEKVWSFRICKYNHMEAWGLGLATPEIPTYCFPFFGRRNLCLQDPWSGAAIWGCGAQQDVGRRPASCLESHWLWGPKRVHIHHPGLWLWSWAPGDCLEKVTQVSGPLLLDSIFIWFNIHEPDVPAPIFWLLSPWRPYQEWFLREGRTRSSKSWTLLDMAPKTKLKNNEWFDSYSMEWG